MSPRDLPTSRPHPGGAGQLLAQEHQQVFGGFIFEQMWAVSITHSCRNACCNTRRTHSPARRGLAGTGVAAQLRRFPLGKWVLWKGKGKGKALGKSWCLVAVSG